MTSPNDPQDLSQAFTNPGASAIPNPEEVNNFHRYDDLDNLPESHHHTLGGDPNQASPGDHNHDGRGSKVLQGYALTTHDHGVSGGTVTGSIVMFAAAIPPDGWVLCNGQTLDRAAFADLFAVIGTTYGSTNTSNFLVPNLSSRFPVGAGTLYSLGASGGSKDHGHFSANATHSHGGGSHAHVVNDLGHTHDMSGHSHGTSSHSHTEGSHTHSTQAHGHSVVSGNHAHGGIVRGAGATDSTQAPTVFASSEGVTVNSGGGSGTGGTTVVVGTSSVAPAAATTGISINSGGGGTDTASVPVYASEIDKSLPPYLALAFIIKA